MRREFLTWLSAAIGIAIVLAAALVYSQFSMHVQDRAESIMRTRLVDMLDFFTQYEKTLTTLNAANEESTLDRARAIAEITALDPRILHDQEKLQGICNRINAEQLAISDGSGTVIAGVPQSLVGLDMKHVDDIRSLTAQPGSTDSILASNFRYGDGALCVATVPRVNEPGSVRLGFLPSSGTRELARKSIYGDRERLRLGEHGIIVVFLHGRRLTRDEPLFSDDELLTLRAGRADVIESEQGGFVAYAMERNGFRAVGLLPIREVYNMTLRTMSSLLLSNLLLFVMVFFVVSRLLQRIVLRGLSQVNTALQEITEGELERRVEVTTCPEFARLSDGINFMVDSLRSVGEERQFQVKRDLELARAIQTAALPNKFPVYPHVAEFDICATCIQSRDVGGDFYDLYMPDPDHLHFLVADVDSAGIPAALYMMRAMVLIRTLARAGGTPVSIIEDANRELCAENQVNPKMAIFYGCLNIRNGVLEYVCAGHTHCLLRRLGHAYEPFGMPDAPPLGEVPDTGYSARTLTLQPGEWVFLYTSDMLLPGAADVPGTESLPYTESQLRESLSGPAGSAADVLQLVRSSLRRTTEIAHPDRDCTMLSLLYRGTPSDTVEYDLRDAGAPEQALNCVEKQMMNFFAAPSDISAVQGALRSLLAVLPAQTQVHFTQVCSAHRIRIVLRCNGPQLNLPQRLLQPLPMEVESCTYSDNTNTLTLCKELI